MGTDYAENVILDLEKMWEESDNRTPLINLLSMGADPTGMIEMIAKKHKLGWFIAVLFEDYLTLNIKIRRP